MLFFQNHQWKFRYDPRTKDQASSTKPQAPIFRKLQAASIKHQALQVPSGKLQAQNNKRQASSRK
jgi:hypothetical protein